MSLCTSGFVGEELKGASWLFFLPTMMPEPLAPFQNSESCSESWEHFLEGQKLLDLRVAQRAWQNEEGKEGGNVGFWLLGLKELDTEQMKELASLLTPDDLALLTKGPLLIYNNNNSSS